MNGGLSYPVEEMAAQLMQQNVWITPEHALIQSLAILPVDEYGTFNKGQTLNRDQIKSSMKFFSVKSVTTRQG